MQEIPSPDHRKRYTGVVNTVLRYSNVLHLHQRVCHKVGDTMVRTSRFTVLKDSRRSACGIVHSARSHLSSERDCRRSSECPPSNLARDSTLNSRVPQRPSTNPQKKATRPRLRRKWSVTEKSCPPSPGTRAQYLIAPTARVRRTTHRTTTAYLATLVTNSASDNLVENSRGPTPTCRPSGQ